MALIGWGRRCPFTVKGAEVAGSPSGMLVKLWFKEFLTGTTTSTTSNKLVDSGGDFVNDGVKINMYVVNTTDDTHAKITAVTATELTLDTDIFTSGEDYSVIKGNVPLEMMDADGSYPALSDGGDIRVSSDIDGDNLLDLHIRSIVVSNDPSDSVLEAAFSINTTGSDQTVYLWYNKAGESQPAPSAAGGYEGVYDICFAGCPLDETSSPFEDWSANGADATANGSLPTRVNGEVTRYEQDFDGNDWANWDSNELTTVAEDVVVFSCWVTPRGVDAYMPVLGSVGDGSDGDFSFWIDSEFDEIGMTIIGNEIDEAIETQVWSLGTQYHIAFRYRADQDLVEFYVNGSSVGTVNFDVSFALRLQEAVRLGRDNFSDYFDGEIDEVLLIDATKGDSWMTTYYNSWATPEDFIDVGTPVSPAGPGNLLIHPGTTGLNGRHFNSELNGGLNA